MHRLVSITLMCSGCYAGPGELGRDLGPHSAGSGAATTGSTGDPGESSGPVGDTSSSSSSDCDPGSTTCTDGSDVDPVCPAGEVLLDRSAEVFTASPEQPFVKVPDVGQLGTAYSQIEIRFDLAVGEFRAELPPDDIPRWDHILFGLYRANQPKHWQRYLLGASARIEQDAADRAFNYARVDVAEGHMSYVAWKQPFAWAEHTDYRVVMRLDADASEQTLEVYRDDLLEKSIAGPIDYYDPSLTQDGLFLELGTEDADWGLHVSPHGWSFSDLTVCGQQAR